MKASFKNIFVDCDYLKCTSGTMRWQATSFTLNELFLSKNLRAFPSFFIMIVREKFILISLSAYQGFEMLAYKRLFSSLFEELRKVVIGQDLVVEQTLISILSGGNALLEGYPGLAKTLTVRTLAKSMNMNFSRIQFTPDLMPSDITGTYVLEEMEGSREFKFRPGPIFANIVLADEINRASPKTQSALLESMQEKQVTLGSTTYKLDKPFFVLATQNPIEQEGSLSLNQYVLIDGNLKKGFEIIKNLGKPTHETKGKKFYDTNSWTMALNAQGRLEKAKCMVYTVDYKKNFVSITTETGKSIKVTKNHPFLVNDNGIISWKKAEDLTVQDYLVNPSKINVQNQNFETINHEAARKISMDDDLAFWLGAVLASGNVENEDRPYVEMKQTFRSEEFERFIETSRKHGYEPEILSEEAFFIARIRSKELVEYLTLQFGIVPGDDSIPEKLLNLPEKMNREFIRTFVSLSQPIMKKSLILFQAESQVNVLSYMLLREGIVSWISRIGDLFRMEVKGSDLLKYSKRIGHLQKSEMQKMSSFPDLDKTFRKVPIQRKSLLKLMELIGLEGYEVRRIRSKIWYPDYKEIKEGEALIAAEALEGLVGWVEQRISELASSGFVTKAKVVSKKTSVPVEKIEFLKSLSNPEMISRNIQTVKQEGNQINVKIQIKSITSERRVSQLDEASKLLNYFKGLLTDYVFYDRVKSISYSKPEEKAFGLTVPGLKNYLGGFGGCGINHNTYPLPEAQSDRFLLKIKADYPNFDDEMKIVNMYASDTYETVPEIVMNKTDILDLQQLTKQVPIASDLKRKVVELVTSTRRSKDIIEYGASPRASIGLVVASKARALVNGRNHVSKEDIVSVAFPVLRHRIMLNFETERKGMTPDDVIESLTKKIK